MSSNIIKHEDQVIIQLPSENLKLITVRSDSSIDLGKFGKFQSNDIIGKPYGYSYRIEKNRAYVARKDADLSEIEETSANNQNIVANPENQKLTFEQIETMKASIESGETSHKEIVDAIIANHSEFDKKTEYSKAKYINKKKKKFNNIFTPLEPNQYNICQFFFDKNPSKIRELRVDTLSQIMTSANIHAQSKVLVIDDTQGLIVGSVMERLAGFGKVFAIHEAEFPNYDIIRYFNFPQSHHDSLFTISWDKLNENYEEPVPVEPEIMDETNTIKFERKKTRYQNFINKRQEIYDGNFDCLIISSFINPWSVISKLKQFVGPSRPVVIYSQYKEPLTNTAAQLMASDEFIYTQLSESWLRHYQVLPGRTHPDMSMSATGGYLLSCTKVIPNPEIEPITQGLTKRQKHNFLKS